MPAGSVGRGVGSEVIVLIQEKLDQAAGILRTRGVDCWLTFTRESSINGDPVLPFLLPAPVTWHTAVIVTPSGYRCAVVGRYDRAAVEEIGVYSRVRDYVEGIKEILQEELRALDPAAIAVNFSKDSEICDGLTHGMYLVLEEILSGIGYADRLCSAEEIVSALRERKTPAEAAAIREAVDAAEAIFREAGAFIRPGRTEQEIAAFMSRRRAAAGLEPAWDAATCPSVFTGPDTAEAHFRPTNRPVEPGHLVSMDFGVKVRGYCSDLQRCFYVCRPGEEGPPEAVRRGFDTLRRAVEEARAALRPGVQGKEVDAAARGVVTGAGYAPFPHGLGHQVGRFAHDGTALLGPAWEKYAGKPFRRIEEGMVFTLEPRLTVEGHGIATVEEMVLVNRDGAEYLFTPQERLHVIRP